MKEKMPSSEPDPQLSLDFDSELEQEIQKVMETEGPGFKDNRKAAKEMAELRLKHKKAGMRPYENHGRNSD